MMKECYFTTNIGSKKFPSNQDSLLIDKELICQTSMSTVSKKIIKENSAIFAVADGISSHKKSHIISCKVLEFLYEIFSSSNHFFPVKSIKKIQDRLENISLHSKELKGSATTLAGVYFADEKATIFHTGDSRVYLFRDKKLKPLTTDHTQAQRMLKSGEISRDEFESCSDLYKMLEGYLICGELEDEELIIDSTKIDVKEDDLFFICSDGVTESIDDKELETLFKSSKLETFVNTLFNEVHKKEIDNFSFIAIKIKKGVL
ncbi:PP2C family protein-serine/threonine phosphatase [Hydrogenimonas thermophila]|uniref:Serine/threonine protein phosphatase PrpC n=2 Tax=Hydrogenimonas thermophila TaxID=223786 RepID=A0A1I5V1D3_9BACT|nr:protein phosphatase 2C domain-containing protein [Hydrogenimonas thermophila]WOE71082.1 protein phosphatase 2C domain-containing protein [Hydrogenimonas thermophila]SFQ00766.1 Serine/threonine protein phosphatase PrpC [Hydrogenimonas thermophila]